MKKVTFALFVAALPLLAGCFGKDKEEVKTEAVQTVSHEESSMSENSHEEATSTEEAHSDEKE